MIAPKSDKNASQFLKDKSGQILTSVIVFIAFGLSVIALSSILTIINLQNTAKNIISVQALSYAEAGVEDAILRLIRDPAYPGGVATLDSATVAVTISGDAINKTVTSTATYNGFTKKIVVVASLANNKLTLVSWKQGI